jgi:hypothetical protein
MILDYVNMKMDAINLTRQVMALITLICIIISTMEKVEFILKGHGKECSISEVVFSLSRHGFNESLNVAPWSST